jgi:Transposase domain (DUF772)
LDAPDGEADDVWRRSRLAAPVPLSVPPRGFVRASPAKYPDRPNRDLSASALLLHFETASPEDVQDCRRLRTTLIGMLIVGYCFGIRSERRLCEEVHLNLAYRWCCRLGLDADVPDHSTF